MLKNQKNRVYNNFYFSCIFFILITLLTCEGCCKVIGDKSLPITNLKILTDPEPFYSKIINRTGWKKIVPRTLFAVPYVPKKEFQNVWYKAEFRVKNPENFYGITLGRVYFTDLTYLNGTLIGKRELSDSTDAHFPRYYKIPANLLKKGMNTLYVRVGIYGREFGGIRGNIELMSHDYFTKSRLLKVFIFRQLPLGIFIFFGCQIISGLIFYFSRRKEFVNLVTLGIFFVWTSYLLALYAPYYPFSMDYRITYLWTNVHIAPIFFFSYIQAHYKLYAQKMNAIVMPLLLLFALITITNPDTVSDFYPARILAIISVTISTISGLYLFVLIGLNKPNKTMIIFIIFGAIPVSTVVWDIIDYLFISHQPPLTQIYALPFVFILFMVLQISDTLKKEQKLAELKLKLSEKFKPSKKPKKEVNLTATMEEKLSKLKEFINENYESPISREEIADALHLSPDYMSRMFKAHTGEKINDYLNRMRIENAKQQLLETNKKIIDIAFSVGFESLVTFNRAFSKFNNTSPSKFRQSKGAEGILSGN